MKDISIHGTTKSPEVNFSIKGELNISGRSFLENTKEFYEPLIMWLTEYIKSPAPKTSVNFEFEYFNTSSQLWIFRIVEILLDLVKLNKNVEFNWYYSEEEIKEVGIDLANLLGIKMNFIKKAG
jgi:hypothetical protein